jgi:hypothetical protein
VEWILKPYFPEESESGSTVWERWVRCLVGMKFSPYVCIKGLLIALEMVKGNQWDESNAFQWGDVHLNLPGDSDYSPGKPRIYRTKVNSDKIAALILSYVDDMRAADGTEDDCWKTMHQVATILNYLGIQVATRKTRPPTRHPGAWAGSTVISDANGVGVKATQEKWDKTKSILKKLWEWLEEDEMLDRKELESMRGSLVYLQRTYPAIMPYIKGLHLTIDSWRPSRSNEGWKVVTQEKPLEGVGSMEAPSHVKPVPRLVCDVSNLMDMFKAKQPPVRYVRSKQVNVALYGFGDASGAGFGRTVGNTEGVSFCHGLWGKDEESDTSNYRELNNLVLALEDGLDSGQMTNSEIWIFTDNSTAESVFWKGHSSNPRLNYLALHLRKLEMGGLVKIQMVHVPGTCMISQGTDGLSRGDFSEGVMTGKSILDYIPLNRSALERSPKLLKWIQSWIPSEKIFMPIDRRLVCKRSWFRRREKE